MKLTALILIQVMVLLVGCGQAPPESAVPDPTFRDMNVILISLDTLRRDRTGMYGYPLPVSPYLDGFSRDATVFMDVMAQCPSTASSHRSLFTSRYLHAMGESAPVPENTMAGLLRQAGWRTAAFTDGGMMSRKFGHAAGFETYADKFIGTGANVDLAREWINDHSAEKFFLFLHTYEIHSPYFPPEPLPEYYARDHPSELDLKKTEHFDTTGFTDDDFGYISGMYDGDIRACESKLRQFFNDLKRRGIYDNTIIILMSDHGESLGERMYVGHNLPYSVQLEVPLVVRLPGRQIPLVEGPVENVDLLPTLLKLLNLEVPERLQGIDLVPAMFRRPGITLNRHRLSEARVKTIRSADGWHLILRETPETDELYYLPDDPEELRNVVQSCPEVAVHLRTTLSGRTGWSIDKMRAANEGLREHQAVMKVKSDPDEIALRKELSALGYIED